MRSVRTTGRELLEQIQFLRAVREELLQAEQIIRRMSFPEEICRILQNCAEELEHEAVVFRQTADCIEQAEQLYRKAEQKITAGYDEEPPDSSPTVFAKSRFSGLEGLKNLFPFHPI